jgi:hypothetical protein
MSKLLPVKAEISMELDNLSQKIKYRDSINFLEIAINTYYNITSIRFILFVDSFIGLEETLDKSNKCPISFPILDLDIQ